MSTLYAVQMLGGSTASVRLTATTVAAARAEVDAADTQAWYDAGRCEIEDALGICLDGIHGSERDAIEAAGAVEVADIGDGWTLWQVAR